MDRDNTDRLDYRATQALAALEAGDARTLWNLLPGSSIPTRQLEARHVPAEPDWGFGSLAEAFALGFDGYAWGEAQPAPVDPRQLAVDVEQGAAIQTWTADALRAALFGLQRRYRDGVSSPDRAHVERLLTALRDRLAG